MFPPTFFELVRSNQLANQSNYSDLYSKIKTIDDCFIKGGENLINPESETIAMFFLRCQYAFKTAAGMALAGQVVEVFVILRSVLEYAGYALIISNDPNLEDVWIKRVTVSNGKTAQRKEFNYSAAKSAVKRCDARLEEIFIENYERTLDFGARPNPYGVFSAMNIHENEGNIERTILAISNEPKVVQHALKCTAQTGLTALHIFQHIFGAKFELLGIRNIMDDLKATGQL